MISDNQNGFKSLTSIPTESLFTCSKCEGIFKESKIELHYLNCNYEDFEMPTDEFANDIIKLSKNTSSADNLSINCPGCNKIVLSKDPHIKKCADEKSRYLIDTGTIECSICKKYFKFREINDHEVNCAPKYLEKENAKYLAILLNFTEYPSDWSRGMTDNLRMDQLESLSEEYLNLERRFHLSCKNYNVLKIERIQNKKLWDRYTREKNRVLAEKGSCKEHFLFHGCRTHEPDYIIKTGFDISFANDGGMFGRGNYFARLASYSCPAYCYQDKTNPGTFYVFVAKVITGIPHVTNRGQGFKKPPFWDEGKKIYFDSCTNVDNSSDNYNTDQMYVIYDNEKAYPYYMITYTTNSAIKK
jgi:hypothetical protein